MTHSHMPVQHLLKQVETYRPQRGERDVRPRWVTDFINETAELFEPIRGLGRVGFDCQLAEDCWVVAMYLGSTEIVGGKDDGQSRPTDFQFDLLELIGRFTEIDHFRWSAFPSGSEDADRSASQVDRSASQVDSHFRSCIAIEGRIEENSFCVQLFSEPPRDVGPGFREYPDGRRETV